MKFSRTATHVREEPIRFAGRASKAKRRINPEWVSAPYECIFYIGPTINIGPPPKKFKKSACRKSKPVIYSRAYGKENKTSVS